MPCSRKDGGKIPGANVATTLYRYAVPEPSAISVNMFKLRVRMDTQPRSKSGHPPHKTTGVATANSNHREWTPRYIVAISTAANGKLNQNLRSIATYRSEEHTSELQS